jgi:hypothetical protein
MDRAITVRGNLSDPSHIELDEPVSGIKGPVEVTVRQAQKVTLGHRSWSLRLCVPYLISTLAT